MLIHGDISFYLLSDYFFIVDGMTEADTLYVLFGQAYFDCFVSYWPLPDSAFSFSSSSLY